MSKLKFSYIFDEEIDRVYDCFANAEINKDILFPNLVSSLEFTKGDRFDTENSEFSFTWKNYYKIKMIVQNVKRDHKFRTFTFRSLGIDRIPMQISMIHSYYWDTVDLKTVFILDLEYQDDFFEELIKAEVKETDIMKMCQNIENYLNSIIQGLEIRNTFLMDFPIEEIWKTISNPEIFFSVSGKKLIPIFKDKEVNLDSILEFIDSNDKRVNPTILTQMKVVNLFVTTNLITLTFLTFKRLYIANHKITFIIKRIDSNKSLFISSVRLLEPTDHKKYLTVTRFWKKVMTTYYNYAESKNKKKNK